MADGAEASACPAGSEASEPANASIERKDGGEECKEPVRDGEAINGTWEKRVRIS